jgi:hypothetical protein
VRCILKYHIPHSEHSDYFAVLFEALEFVCSCKKPGERAFEADRDVDFRYKLYPRGR